VWKYYWIIECTEFSCINALSDGFICEGNRVGVEYGKAKQWGKDVLGEWHVEEMSLRSWHVEEKWQSVLFNVLCIWGYVCKCHPSVRIRKCKCYT